LLATKSKNGKRLGRPPIEYTPEQIAQIEQMAETQCKDATIAEALGLDVKTFQKHNSKFTRQKRAQGKATIYANQYRMAQNQPVMAIWLGKQHLEQADKAELSGETAHKVTVTVKAGGRDVVADIVDDDGNRPDGKTDRGVTGPE